MKRSHTAVVVLTLAVAEFLLGPAIGEEPPATLKLPSNVFAQEPNKGNIDLVLFGGQRPVFVRLHIMVEGQEFRVIWDEVFQQLHAYLDIDRNGSLTVAEANRMDWPLLFHDPLAVNPEPRPGKGRDAMKSHHQGNTISPHDLSEHIRTTQGIEAFGSWYGRPPNPGIEAIFAHLDRDGNQSLSLDELRQAEASLLPLDRDEDELIALNELDADRSPFASPFGDVNTPGKPIVDETCPLMPLDSDDDRQRAAKRLMRDFGHACQDGKSLGIESRTLSTDPAFGRAGDRNGDSLLNLEELGTVLKDVNPDLEVMVTIDATGKSPKTRLVAPPLGRPSPVVIEISEHGANLVAEFAGLEMAFRAVDLPAIFGLSAYGEFSKADRDENGSVDSAEAKGNRLMQHIFPVADRDGTAVLTDSELRAYIKLLRSIIKNRTRLLATDHGLTLHSRIDTNHDGLLSARELREAHRQVESLDRNGDGQISLSEVPRRYEICVGRSFGIIMGFAIGPSSSPAPPEVSLSRTKQAPPWFLAMDRNGDGDVSPREFYGPPATFGEIDHDGDRLIDPDEASKVGQREAPPENASLDSRRNASPRHPFHP